MTVLALLAIGLLALTVDAYYWAKNNFLPPDSMLTLQRFRMDCAPVPEMAVIHQALIFSTRAPPEVPVDYGLAAEDGDGLLYANFQRPMDGRAWSSARTLRVPARVCDRMTN